MAQIAKCLPALRETRVQSLGQEDPLEKEVATRSSILAEKSCGQRAWGATIYGVTKSRTQLNTRTHKCMCRYCSVLP